MNKVSRYKSKSIPEILISLLVVFFLLPVVWRSGGSYVGVLVLILFAGLAFGITYRNTKDIDIHKISPLRTFGYGALAAIVLAGASLLFLNIPQCSEQRTTDCATGANIGLGMAFMVVYGIWFVTVAMGLAEYTRITLARTDLPRAVLVVQAILVSIATLIIAFGTLWLFQNYLLNHVVDDGYRGPDGYIGPAYPATD